MFTKKKNNPNNFYKGRAKYFQKSAAYPLHAYFVAAGGAVLRYLQKDI